MKSIKKYVVWIMLSLFLQMSMYFYLDKYFFVNETVFTSKKIDNTQNTTKLIENTKIPEKSEDLTLSYDGKYASYIEAGKLKIINLQTAEEEVIPFAQGVNISFYKWLPDRDRMFIAEKEVDKDSPIIKFSYYDVKTNDNTQLSNVFINLNDANDEVENMELSTLTNVIYIKIGQKGYISSVYRINVMGSIEEVASGFIGNIKIMTTVDKMLYEDISDSQIKVAGLDQTVNIRGVANLALISIDNEDNVYVGQVEQNKIVKIFSGTLDENTDSWKITVLKNPVERKNLFVSLEGRIYVNDSLSRTVKDITSNQETSYKGSFLEIDNNIISSIKNNLLFETTIK